MEEQKYIQERQRRAMRSKVTGIVLTVSLHGLLLASCFYTGFTYLDPPPPEKEQILIEFDPVEVEKPKQVWNGTQPRAKNGFEIPFTNTAIAFASTLLRLRALLLGT